MFKIYNNLTFDSNTTTFLSIFLTYLLDLYSGPLTKILLFFGLKWCEQEICMENNFKESTPNYVAYPLN